MARGFNTTLGVGSTDRYQTPLTAHSTQRTWSILAFIRDATASGGNSRIWDKGTAATSSERIQITGSGANLVFVRNFSTTAGQWTMPMPPSGSWQNIIIQYDSSAVGNNPLAWFNGVSQTVTPSVTPIGSATTDAQPYSLGNRASGVAVFDGMLTQWGVWDRFITAGEIVQLSQFYSPLFILANRSDYAGMVGAIPPAFTVVGTAIQLGQIGRA